MTTDPTTPPPGPAPSVADLLAKLGIPDVASAYEQAHQLGFRVWELAGDSECSPPGSVLQQALRLLADDADDVWRREQWAAAYRHAGTVLVTPGREDLFDIPASRWLLHAADQIESGTLTAWADTPEPATAPAQPVQDGPVGDDAPVGTSVVLARALLADGHLWGLAGDDDHDLWHNAGWGDLTRAGVEAECGAATEVLLVSLAAAVDATAGDRPAEPTPAEIAEALAAGNVGCVLPTDRDMQAFAELPDCPACEGTGKDLPPDWRDPAPVAADLTVPTPPIEPMDLDERERAAFAELAEGREPVPESDGGPGWTRYSIVRIIELVATSPLGASGDGDQLRALLADRDVWASDAVAQQRRAARAERDVGYWSAMAGDRARERDAARAEVERWRQRVDVGEEAVERARAEAEQLVDRGYRAMTEAQRERDTARAELTRTAGEVDDLRRTLLVRDGQLREMTEQRDKWRNEVHACHGLQGNVAHVLGVQTDWDEAGRKAVLDSACRLTGNLADAEREVARLDEELVSVRSDNDRLRKERDFAHQLRDQAAAVRARRLATARRDAGADALEEAANDASRLLGASGERAFTAADLRARASEMRARPIPASQSGPPAGRPTMPRPEQPEAPQGHEYAAAPAGPEWRIEAGKRCRQGAGPHHSACGRPTAAAFNRRRAGHDPPYGVVDSWWAYCGQHMFGKWVEDGQVMQWVLREANDVE